MFLIPIVGKKLYVLLVSPNCENRFPFVLSMAFGGSFGYCVVCKAGGLAWQ